MVFLLVTFSTSNRSFLAHFSFNLAALAPEAKDVTRSGISTADTVIFAAKDPSFLVFKFFKGKTFLIYDFV